MKLLRCHINNFGTLANYKYEFSENKNEIIERNGFGKTTFCAFLKTMFYGLDKQDRKLYQPWGGGIFGGNLDFEVESRVFRVERYFADKDSFLLYDLKTNSLSAEYTENLGIEIFKIDRESFMRSIFFTQSAKETGITDNIKQNLVSVLESDDVGNYEKAKKLLDDKRQSLYKQSGRGEIQTLEHKLSDLRVSRHEDEKQERILRERILSAQASDEKILRLNEQKRTLAAEAEKANESKSNLLLQESLKEKKNAYKTACEALNEDTEFFKRETNKEELDKMRLLGNKLRENGNLSKQKVTIIVALVFAVVLIVGLTVVFFNFAAGLSLIVLGVLGYIPVFCLYMAYRNPKPVAGVKNELFDFLNSYPVEASDYNERLFLIQARLDGYEEKKKLAERKKQELDAFLEQKKIDIDFDRKVFEKGGGMFESRAADIQRQIDELNKIKGGMEKDIEMSELFQNRIAENQSLIIQTEKLLQEKRAELSVVTETVKFLDAAHDALSERYIDKMQAAFLEYADKFECAAGFRIDGKMKIRLERAGVLREQDYFSAGEKDILNIALRLSFAKALFTGSKPFLIFDDPFISLDKKHLDIMKNILDGISKEYQLIYFACHEARALK